MSTSEDYIFTECGKIFQKSQTLCIGCSNASISDHPWHVGVYKKENGKFVHKCGGSIINPKVVLSGMY